MKNMCNSNSIIKMNMDKEFTSMKRWETKKVKVVWKKIKMDKMRKSMKKMSKTSNKFSIHSTSSRTSKKSTKTVI